MEWSDAWSESNQQVHILPGNEKPRQNGQMHAWSESNQQVHIQAENEKAKWNGQMHGQSQMDKFTYKLA